MSYRRAALEKWKQYNGPRATYRKLIAAFEQAGHKDFAGVVQNVAGKYNYCELFILCIITIFHTCTLD